jgi:hypothetical protein
LQLNSLTAQPRAGRGAARFPSAAQLAEEENIRKKVLLVANREEAAAAAAKMDKGRVASGHRREEGEERQSMAGRCLWWQIAIVNEYCDLPQDCYER